MLTILFILRNNIFLVFWGERCPLPAGVILLILDRVTEKNCFLLAPIPGSSGVAGWESSDCRGRGKIAGPECCRSWARATEAGDHSSENQGGETPDGAKDAGGRADSSEAGEGVWPEVCGVVWFLLGCLGGECAVFLRAKPVREGLFLKQLLRVTKPSWILFVPPGTSGCDAGRGVYRGSDARL